MCIYLCVSPCDENAPHEVFGQNLNSINISMRRAVCFCLFVCFLLNFVVFNKQDISTLNEEWEPL